MFYKILELLGTWRLERSIKTVGQVSGKAIFSRETNDMVFYKENILLPNGIKAFREYYYSFDPLSKQTLQLFSNKRVFCFLDFDRYSNTATGKHLCGQDYYYVKYSFINKSSFITCNKIIGPHKNEKIITEYTAGT